MADTWLKQSTSVSVVIGPIWATADGALKADLAYNASGINCDIYKNGTKADVTLADSAGDGYFRAASGEALYLLTLSTGHTDTLGRLEISLSATGYYMKPRSYMVVPANVWDSMFGADYLKTEVVEISGDSTAADNLEADYDGTGYAKTNSTTKLHADYDAAKTAASQSSVNTIAGYLDTEVAAILAAVDTEVAAIKAKTDNLPASPAAVGSAMTLASGAITAAVIATGAIDADALATDAVSEIADGVWDEALSEHTASGSAGMLLGTTIPTAIDAVDNFVDTEVGAIKAVTDKLDTALELDGAVYRYTTNALEQASGTGATAQQVWEYATRTITALDEDDTTLDLDATIAAAVPTAAAIADAVWDEATVDHSGVGSTGAAIAAAGSAGDPWATALPGSYGAGTAGKIVGDNINAPIGTVDAVVDAIKAKTDSLTFTVAGDVDVNVQTWKGSTAPAMTGDAYARLGAPAGASVSADVAAVKSETAAIVADTNELQMNQGNWATATGFSTHSAADVKTAIEAAGSHLTLIKAKTDNLPSDPADQSAVEAAITAAHSTTNGKIDAVDDFVDTEVAAILAAVDTEVAAIKAKTDNLPASPAAVGSAMTLHADYDAAKTAATQASVNTIGGIVDDILEDTGTTIPAAITALTEAGVKKNTALSGFTFYMTDSTNHEKATGLTVTAERSLDGAAFAACANAVAELSDGCYKIDLADTDLNADVVALKFTATDADDLVITIRTSA